jgi:uncharacterized protein (DUF433 family)
MPTLSPAREQQHIYLDAHGVPMIGQTNTKVVEVVRDHLGGLSAERIHEEHAHLSPAQIYAALTYYYDHKPEIDADLARRSAFIDEVRRTALTPTLQELRGMVANKRKRQAG